MTITLFAQPYDICATGFYFYDYESFLKKSENRKMLAANIDHQLDWVFTNGSYDYVAQPVEQIGGHDRFASLLKADFETLEIPKRALTIDITNSEPEIVDTILKYLARKYG